MKTLPIAMAVNVTIASMPNLLSRDSFTSALIVGSSVTTRVEDRGTYYSVEAVAEHYAASTPEYIMATLLFAQSPRPKYVTIATKGADMSPLDQIKSVYEQTQGFYGFCFTEQLTAADMQAVATWAESHYKMPFFVVDDVADAVAAGNTLKALNITHYCLTYHQDVNSAAPIMGMALDQNFDSDQGIKTLKFKTIAAIAPSVITQTEAGQLDAAGVNYYTSYGNTENPVQMYAQGYAGSKKYFDFVIGLDWLRNAIESEVFNTFRTTRKVPQTEVGMVMLKSAIERALQQGVTNKLIAEGVWNGSEIGEVKTGDFLNKGYYIYAPSITSQTQSQRETRQAPPFTVLVKGSGALHGADIMITPEA